MCTFHPMQHPAHSMLKNEFQTCSTDETEIFVLQLSYRRAYYRSQDKSSLECVLSSKLNTVLYNVRSVVVVSATAHCSVYYVCAGCRELLVTPKFYRKDFGTPRHICIVGSRVMQLFLCIVFA